MDDVVIARAMHVLAAVIWIGGVAMVTTVVLPAVRRGDIGPNRLQAFEAIERRYVWHARIATVIVALTGFYITDRLACGAGSVPASSGGCTPWCSYGCCLRSFYSRPSHSSCTDGSTRGLRRRPTPHLPYCSGVTGFCSRSASSRSSGPSRGARGCLSFDWSLGPEAQELMRHALLRGCAGRMPVRQPGRFNSRRARA